MPDVDGDAQRFVAVAFDAFQLAFAHTDAEPATFRGLGAGVGRADPPGMGQRRVDQVFKKGAAVAETLLGMAG